MGRVLRFLVGLHLPGLGVFAVYAVGMTAYAALGGNLQDGVLSTYYYLFPLVPALFLGIFQYTSSVSYLNIALSMGCTRRAFFWGNQFMLLLTSLVVSLLTAFFLFLPQWMGWDWVIPFMPVQALPYLPVATLAVGECMAAAGLLRRISPALGMVCYGVALVALICLGVLVQVVEDAWLWGDLPTILLLVSVFLGGLCLVVEATQTRQAVVR